MDKQDQNCKHIAPRKTVTQQHLPRFQDTAQELEDNHQRYKRFAEAAFEGMAIHDHGVLLEVNPRFCEMFGYTADELVGANGFDLVAPQSKAMVQERVANGLEEPYEAFCQRKDGTIFPAEVHPKSIHLNGKNLRVAAYWDMTKQKKLQEQLAASEKKYRELYENAQVALFRTALDGTLLDCNRATRKFFGYPTEGSLPKPSFSVADSYVNKKRRQQFTEMLKKHQCVKHFDAELKKSTGRHFWVSISAKLDTEHGYIEGALTDITVQKLLTKTEKKILIQLLGGKTNKEIAAKTNRSIRTIEDHRAHIMQKLGANNLIELAKKGLSLELPPEKQ